MVFYNCKDVILIIRSSSLLIRLKQDVNTLNAGIRKTALKIGGMHCAGCITAIQNHMSDIEGIKKCEVNLAAEKAVLEFDSSLIDLEKIENALKDIGYSAVYEKFSVKITGITDSSDSEKLEKRLLEIDGVKEASVNYGNNQVVIKYNSTLLSISDLRRIINKTGFQILSEDDIETSEEIEAKKLKKLFIVGLVFSIPVMFLGYPEFFSFIPFAGTGIAALIIFVCASIVQFVTGSRFYIGAYRITKMKSANMDTLVVTGTTAAYLFSVFNTFPTPAWHNIYYDAASIVITFIILGKYLENKTKGKASSIIKKMLELQPKTARIRKNETETEISIELIQPGGEKIPVDSIVIEGHSAVDESMITGESMPVEKKPGEMVIGSTINKEGALLVRAEKVGSDTMLSQIMTLVEDAMGRKPPMQRLVDKIAGYFAIIVLIVATVTFVSWYFVTPSGEHHIAAAVIPAVAILVVACPCALGLATPTAVMVGMGKGAQHGVIFKGGDALEMLSKIKIAVFDKTGTLTEGKPQVIDLLPLKQITLIEGNIVPNSKEKVLEFAAIAEKNSEHPLAKSIVKKARESNLDLPNPTDFVAIPGRGVRATYNGNTILVGSPKQLELEGVEISMVEKHISQFQQEGKTVVLVALNSQLVGLISLLDSPKQSAKSAIMALKDNGVEVVMLTGDNKRTAATIASDLSIDRVIANVLPSEKVNVIKELQISGKKVAMIGDGINDAAAIMQSDVGIAIGSGTDVALEAGKVILLRDDLYSVVTAIEISKKTVGKIKQNLFYAFAYNTILIPVAGVGLLYPALAGLAMAASSVSVTSSSLLLKRWSPKSQK
jgi:Cu+-exporting ATPase